MNWQERVAAALGSRVLETATLSGGCIGQVYRLRLADGRRVVAKVDGSPNPQLLLEGYMLRYLAEQSHLPVPAVLHEAAGLLLLTDVPGQSHFSAGAEVHAAELLADLHANSAPAYGLAQDTLIGGLHQPNPWSDSWIAFFRDQRLLYMAGEAQRVGRLSDSLFERLTRFATQVERWLWEPERPSLLHGDIWTSNVLAVGDRITGFLDPAIYYGHPEVELAFITLFGTFAQPFFRRYQELRPIAPGFFEERRDIYNLYPLLVHTRLFGGSYAHAVDQTLRQFRF